MELTEELKREIDGKTILEILRNARFGLLGDPMLEGESGRYWMDRMKELRSEDNAAFVAASKMLGWGRMSCPKCDHTMANVASVDLELNVYHCPRCGTVKVEDSNNSEAKVYSPEMRIILTNEQYRNLSRGEEVEVFTTKIILSDIGVQHYRRQA